MSELARQGQPLPQAQALHRVLPLHPDLVAVAFLLGNWAGEGQGKYAGIRPFFYREEMCFGHTGNAFLTYSQRSWSTLDGRPLHCETGYWRAGASRQVELVIAHPSGIAEVEEGTVDGTGLELSSRSIGLTSTAKPVTALARSVRVDGDTLEYTLVMAAVGQPAQQHLSGQLFRVG